MSFARFVTFRSLTVLAFLFLVSGTALGQFRAGIQGTVTDTAGGVVPGARVVLTNKETNREQETTTSSEGFYRFSSLPPGVYSIAVEVQNFRRAVVNDLRVQAEETKGQDVVLETGGISETVTVQAGASEIALETEDPNIRKNISTEEVLRLPQAGRDPYELARLAPGVFGAGARSASGDSVRLPNTSGPGGSNLGIFATENAQPITANGQRVSANNYQIDGTSVNSQTWGGAAVITPSQESVKEVQVTASTYSAEDGRNSGAQVKVVTQNGTNNFHGSLFYRLNDPSLNAFNKFYGVPGVVTAVPTRVERKFNSYGGSLGGPLPFLRFGDGGGSLFRSGKDRLWFFFSYEAMRENNNNQYISLVETDQWRQSIINSRPGTVSAALVSGATAAPRIVQTLPTSCATAGLFVPCQNVSGGLDIGSIGGTYGTYLDPWATGAGFDGVPDLQLAQLEDINKFRGDQYFTRIDFQPTEADRFTVSTFIVPSKAETSDRASQSRPQADIISERTNFAAGFIYNRTFSSTIVNEARFNITRWSFDEAASNPKANFGLPRIEIEAIWGDRLRFGARRGQNTPGLIKETQMDFRDVLTNVIGNHVLKLGGEYRMDINSNAEIGFARPLYTFLTQWNFANGTPIFYEIATDLTGTPARNNAEFKTSELAFFAQDDWKFRPNLTLNLGLRWSYYSPIRTTNGVIGNLRLDQNGGLAGAVIDTDEQLYDSDWNNFGPQVGMAWSPGWFDDKMVIRTGFGMGYDRLPNALLSNARRNPPNGNNFGLCCAGPWDPFLGGRIQYTQSTDGTILGYPRNPLLGAGAGANGLPLNGAIEIYGSPRELPAAYVYRYSLDTQYQLPWNLVGTLGYQGSMGRHFVRILPLHIMAPSTNPNIFAAYFASPDVNTNYNAGIARLQGRFLRQLSFDVNYRFSKSLDTTSFESPTATTNQSYPVDQREEYGPSDFDVRHNITAAAMWDLPIFRNRSSWEGKLLGGWQINGIVTYHTGFPWTPRAFGCLAGNTSQNGNFCDPRPLTYSGQQPLDNTNENFLSPGGIFPGAFIGGDCGSGAGCNRYFSTVVPFNANPFANPPGIGRNVFRGPRYFNVDMSFNKSFGMPEFGWLDENAKLDVRFNFFNIFNTLNLAPFNSLSDPTRVALPSFGTATSALAGRVGEFQVRFSF
jgi:hypothetical protein